MFNFGLGTFCTVLQMLWDLERSANSQKSLAMLDATKTNKNPLARALIGLGTPLLQEDLKQQVFDLLQVAEDRFKVIELQAATDRISRFRRALWQGIDYEQYKTELKYLREAIEDGLKERYVYYYPAEKAKLLRAFEEDWKPILVKFPSVMDDGLRGIDCYASGQYTASVFHMMRVAEIGLRALARERQVTFPKHPLEWADWQNILEQTESKARSATNGMSRGPKRDAMQAFYSSAIAQVHAFKDTYRNVVMHVRRSYDELDALRVIHQVRDFMNGLCAKIGEKTRAPIRRWP